MVEYHTVSVPHKIDRTGWPPGPWDTEPDRLSWYQHGFPCLMIRRPLGNWCGYVAVPQDHPWHGREYEQLAGVIVHGNLTYTDKGWNEVRWYGADNNVDDWWIGFDCGHASDLIPAMLMWAGEPPISPFGVYRDVSYVRAQTENLALQAFTRVLAEPLNEPPQYGRWAPSSRPRKKTGEKS